MEEAVLKIIRKYFSFSISVEYEDEWITANQIKEKLRKIKENTGNEKPILKVEESTIKMKGDDK